mmetsp:Transcript_6038/g.18066  ORF Transcript_6038/g.18066 Transcript_6038/m.18066 type:complete len:481 (+) Transcript_6038:22-1464(+)
MIHPPLTATLLLLLLLPGSAAPPLFLLLLAHRPPDAHARAVKLVQVGDPRMERHRLLAGDVVPVPLLALDLGQRDALPQGNDLGPPGLLQVPGGGLGAPRGDGVHIDHVVLLLPHQRNVGVPNQVVVVHPELLDLDVVGLDRDGKGAPHDVLLVQRDVQLVVPLALVPVDDDELVRGTLPLGHSRRAHRASVLVDELGLELLVLLGELGVAKHVPDVHGHDSGSAGQRPAQAVPLGRRVLGRSLARADVHGALEDQGGGPLVRYVRLADEGPARTLLDGVVEDEKLVQASFPRQVGDLVLPALAVDGLGPHPRRAVRVVPLDLLAVGVGLEEDLELLVDVVRNVPELVLGDDGERGMLPALGPLDALALKDARRRVREAGKNGQLLRKGVHLDAVDGDLRHVRARDVPRVLDVVRAVVVVLDVKVQEHVVRAFREVLLPSLSLDLDAPVVQPVLELVCRYDGEVVLDPGLGREVVVGYRA